MFGVDLMPSLHYHNIGSEISEINVVPTPGIEPGPRGCEAESLSSGP